MKNWKMALALLAVVAMTSTCFAEVQLSVDEGTDVGNGLVKYIVSAVATNGDSMNTVSALALHGGSTLGEAHQVWAFGAPPVPTTYSGLCSGTFWNPAWTDFDTHALYKEFAGTVTTDIDFPVETNLGGNPYGIDTNHQLYGDMFPATAGMGTYVQPETGTVAFSPAVTAMDIMQVVLPAGKCTLLDVRILGPIGGVEGTPVQFRDVLVGVPEPSTIILLVLGALCMVGARLRK